MAVILHRLLVPFCFGFQGPFLRPADILTSRQSEYNVVASSHCCHQERRETSARAQGPTATEQILNTGVVYASNLLVLCLSHGPKARLLFS